MNTHWHLPNILTLIRLIISPCVLPLLIVYFLPLNNVVVNSLLAVFFILFNLTDFFDGYLARRYNMETRLGKLLDPIADKALLFSVLISLVAINKVYFYWAIIFIGRDFFITSLRLIGAEYGISVPVSMLGKIKTAVLMAYVTIVIFNTSPTLWKYTHLNMIEVVLLSVSLILSVWTAVDYFKEFKSIFNTREEV